MGFDCKCGFSFCKKHRLPEDHDCEFDFKEFERKKLENNNKKVVATKMEQF